MNTKELPPLARVAALDVGQRRIGVAISDETGLLARPMLTFDRLPGRERDAGRRDARSLLRLLRKAEARRIVVGHPLRLSGEPSRQTESVLHFAELLRASTELPVELWDERLSTVAAHERLRDAGHRAGRHEEIIDQLAAVVILEDYLAAKSSGRDKPKPAASSGTWCNPDPEFP